MISERINILSKRLYNCDDKNIESHFNYDYHYAAMNIYNNCLHYEKLAKSMAYAIKNLDVYACESDEIAGRIYYKNERAIEEYCPELDYSSDAIKKIKEKYPQFNELKEN